MESKKIFKQSESEETVIKITMNDGIERECAIVTIVEDDSNKFIALLPLDKEHVLKGKLLLYRLIENEEIIFDEIFNDEEYDYILDILTEILDDQGYYELLAKYRTKFKNDNK